MVNETIGAASGVERAEPYQRASSLSTSKQIEEAFTLPTPPSLRSGANRVKRPRATSNRVPVPCS
jgi:hypothetical protein